MRLRRALYPAIALGLATTLPAASAAPLRPVCNLLADEAGDGRWSLGAGVVVADALDIVSGDVSTGAKEMVGTLRLKSLNFASQNWEELGYRWTLGVTAKGTDYLFWARRTAGLSGTFSGGMDVGGAAVPKVAFKVNGNNLEWRVARGTIKTLGQPKLVFVDFRGTSSAMSSSADSAFSEKSKYADRYPSCFRAL